MADYQRPHGLLDLPVPEEYRHETLVREELRALLKHDGRSLEQISQELEWEPGRAERLLSGSGRPVLEDLIDFLGALDVAPTAFYRAVEERTSEKLLDKVRGSMRDLRGMRSTKPEE